ALVVKAQTSATTGQLDVLRPAMRHPPKTLGRRIERLKGLSARRLHPFAVDQQTAQLAHEILDVLRQTLGKARRYRRRPIGPVRCGDGHARLLTLTWVGADR